MYIRGLKGSLKYMDGMILRRHIGKSLWSTDLSHQSTSKMGSRRDDQLSQLEDLLLLHPRLKSIDFF